eukprot:TRINITY_DN1382_c0_g1_i2.p1 TRINITY_DN1382_c0_g1~~TRINITY_DN1382_c0_g1_i2.p1  ORF type:complete len:325 (-),score=32.55 TRINITY_DN1382_c0_g1_i2:138-1112(-)
MGDVMFSESGSESTEELSGSEEGQCWISWYCGLKGNEFLCEVDEDFVQDDFNLSGLAAQVPYYESALDRILDGQSNNLELLNDEQNEVVQKAAEMLYGMIHARYIITARGLNAMAEKFRRVEFGRCQRVLCNGQPYLPVGMSDIPGQSTVKLFCPKCEEIYYTISRPSSAQLDGAYFGTTFPHLLLMSYSALRPPRSTEKYVPKIFGFKIHHTAYLTDAERQQIELKEKQEQLQRQQLQQQQQQGPPPSPPPHLQPLSNTPASFEGQPTILQQPAQSTRSTGNGNLREENESAGQDGMVNTVNQQPTLQANVMHGCQRLTKDGV